MAHRLGCLIGVKFFVHSILQEVWRPFATLLIGKGSTERQAGWGILQGLLLEWWIQSGLAWRFAVASDD